MKWRCLVTYGQTKVLLEQAKVQGSKSKHAAFRWAFTMIAVLFFAPFWYNMVLVIPFLILAIIFGRAWSARRRDAAHWEDVLFRARDLWSGNPQFSPEGFRGVEPPDDFALEPKKLWPQKYDQTGGYID